MNIAAEINSVIRKIASTGNAHRVVLERAFATDAADLWDACTIPERLARWFEPVRGHLTPGGRYLLTLSGTEGEILRCDPPRQLAITWEYAGDVSHVDVDFIATGDRTVLRLTHQVPPDDHWETYGPAATGVGWEESLRALSLHLADADRSVAAELQDHAGNDESQDLIRRAAVAWGRADETAGTPVADAEARADRTATFYLQAT